ncbi:MAG: peptidoglycan DD-metalloendopeptidase family protein [Clostridia bacterium]|nr:peptidoglycan DD-metalloendopeptidase family protein [Clostridia bacterium]
MKMKLFKRNTAVKLASFVLALTMSVGGVLAAHSEDYKSDINDTKEQITDTQNKLSEIQKTIQDRQDALTNIAQELAAMEIERLSHMSDKDVAIEELKMLRQEIENFDAEIEAMEQQHAELEELLLDRSRIMYQSASDFEFLQILFHSTDLFDFLRKLDVYHTMIEEDKALMESVRESERQLREKREQQVLLSADKEQIIAELDAAIAELEGDQDYVTENYEALSAMLSGLEAREYSYTSEIDELTDKLNELERKQREAEEAARKAEEERKRKEEEARKAAEAEKKRLEEEARKAAEAAKKAKEEAEKAAKEKAEAEKKAAEALKAKKAPKDWNFCWPIEHYTAFTGKFGYRIHPITKVWQLHSGVDLSAAKGTKIYAAQSGTVTMARSYAAYGLCVIIDHGDGLQTVYGHCSKLLVTEGQTVTRGQNIALVGMTGGATGPHLHFEVRENGKPVDPLPYVAGLY